MRGVRASACRQERPRRLDRVGAHSQATRRERKKLIPLALYWLLLIAALRIGRDQGWNSYVVLGAGVAVGALAWAALGAALRQGGNVEATAS